MGPTLGTVLVERPVSHGCLSPPSPQGSYTNPVCDSGGTAPFPGDWAAFLITVGWRSATVQVALLR